MPTINFFWDEVSDNVLVETDQNNQVVTTYIQRPEKFGKVLYHKQGNEFAYYHYDGSGSTRTLTDDTQSVTKSYIFSGHGDLIASPGLGSTPFAYKGAAGYYTNPVTNDIYVRARTYQPTTGRWLSKDPLEFVDGPNLYKGYFVPRGIDPSGLSECFLHASWFTIGTIERANPKPGIPPWVARIRDLACVRKIQDAIRDLWRGVKESKDCPIGWAPCCYTDVFRFERRYLFDVHVLVRRPLPLKVILFTAAVRHTILDAVGYCLKCGPCPEPTYTDDIIRILQPGPIILIDCDGIEGEPEDPIL